MCIRDRLQILRKRNGLYSSIVDVDPFVAIDHPGSAAFIHEKGAVQRHGFRRRQRPVGPFFIRACERIRAEYGCPSGLLKGKGAGIHARAFHGFGHSGEEIPGPLVKVDFRGPALALGGHIQAKDGERILKMDKILRSAPPKGC